MARPHTAAPDDLAALGRRGLIGIGIPVAEGGQGGTLADMLATVVQVTAASAAAGRRLAVQRHFAEVLRTGRNRALAEYRLGDILDGSIPGACTASWPESPGAGLQAVAAGSAWRLTGTLPVMPNIGRDWFLVSAALDTGAQDIGLLSSEQDGLHRVAQPPDAGDDSASVQAQRVLFRADELVQWGPSPALAQWRRLADLLRCALQAGQLQAAAEAMPAHGRGQARAEVRRVMGALLALHTDSGELPDLDTTRAARRMLRELLPA